ncbi:MAG: hypothetical protein ACI93S_000594 [Ancylomarina sp.]|jgi:hypothetical protein
MNSNLLVDSVFMRIDLQSSIFIYKYEGSTVKEKIYCIKLNQF